MPTNKQEVSPHKLIHLWIKSHHRSFDRWEKILTLLIASPTIDYTNFFISLRELSDLVRSAINLAFTALTHCIGYLWRS